MTNQALSNLFHFWRKLRIHISGCRTQVAHCFV